MQAKIGDTVTGFGEKSKKMIHIIIDGIGISDSYVTGLVIANNRLTRKRDFIKPDAKWDVLKQEHRPAGWQPSDAHLNIKISLSGRIRDMDVGDMIEVKEADHKVDTCRNITARIAINEARAYTVNRTENGCTITRKE